MRYVFKKITNFICVDDRLHSFTFRDISPTKGENLKKKKIPIVI
jgi:hypothetical protein